MKTAKEQEQLNNLRHSAAHLLAAAVLDLWPGTKNTIGPSIEDGFYYDFEFKKPISENDIEKIEKKMKTIGKEWKEFTRNEVTPAEAKKEFKDNDYKKELIDEFSAEGQTLTIYQSGSFRDLCRGGHVPHPNNKIKHFKLLSLAGAYWRGDEKNTMLTRIYGTIFPTRAGLDEYINMLNEAKLRDHRKLGKELDLFSFSELVGPGLPLWTPKGTLLRNLLDERVWELRKARGYERVEIPHISKKDLYVTSGHWEKFSDELFKMTTREGHEFAMKPMNCPHHTQIYARNKWSYRDLPQRYANTTMCYRDEQTGELHGISRTRAFEQDDAHVFCRTTDVKEEMNKIWDIVEEFYGLFGFELSISLSLHDPENMKAYLGEAKNWKEAEVQITKLAKERKTDCKVETGEAAFYGPKIDFIAKDSIKRKWQVATIQLDMNMPERFDLTCVNEAGKDERIVMIHAAIMGSIERFLSVLIEHYAGNFPLWLSPVQVRVAAVSDKHNEFTKKLATELSDAGIRIDSDLDDETVGNKIRKAVGEKIPYTLVIGDKEEKSNEFSVRLRGEKNVVTIKKVSFISKLHDKIASRDSSLAL